MCDAKHSLGGEVAWRKMWSKIPNLLPNAHQMSDPSQQIGTFMTLLLLQGYCISDLTTSKHPLLHHLGIARISLYTKLLPNIILFFNHGIQVEKMLFDSISHIS